MPDVWDLHPLPDTFRPVSSAFASLPRDVVLHRRGVSLFADAATIEERFVLALALRGSSRLIVNGRLFTLGPDQGLLLFPFQTRHHAQAAKDDNPFWLFATFDMADRATLEPLRDRPFALGPAGVDLVDRMQRAWRFARDGSDRARGGDSCLWLALLLSTLLRERGAHAIPRSRLPENDVSRTIRAVVRYVNRHKTRPVSVEEVARAAAVSESHLRGVFRRAVGTSLGSFIRRVRLRHACRMLRERGLNVTETAEACGYSSPYAFSRVFGKELGMTPSEYRRRG